MLQMVKKYSLLVVLFLLAACDRYDFSGIVSSPSKDVDKRFEQSEKWNNSHGETIVSVPTDDYYFYVASDMHISESVEHLTTFLTLERNDNTAYFSLILGDMVDKKGVFDLFYSSLAYNSSTQNRNDTVFTTVGNHDLYFDQWNDYARCFGTATYKFVVETPNHKDLFFALDSGSATLGNKQLKWLQKELSNNRKSYRRCIVFTHTNFFKDSFSQLFSGNYSENEMLELTELFSQNNVDLVLTGHAHSISENVYKNVRYLTLGALTDASFLFVCCGDVLSYEFLKL